MTTLSKTVAFVFTELEANSVIYALKELSNKRREFAVEYKNKGAEQESDRLYALAQKIEREMR